MTFIAGAYTATYGGSTIGQTEEGFELDYAMSADPIRGDNQGDTVQNGVFRGVHDYVVMGFQSIEWDSAGLLAAYWPWVAAFGRTGVVGVLLDTFALALVLTKVTGPNATPTSLTASKAVLAPGYPLRHLFAPRLRRIPLRLALLPYVNTNTVHFTTT